MKIETIQSMLNRNEKIVSSYPGTGFLEFRISFQRFIVQKQTFDVSVSFDENQINIRYYYPECSDWAMDALLAFAERLKTHIQELPEYRMRFVTGAMKLTLKGYTTEDYEREEIDVYEMSVFFIGTALAFASLFEIFFLFRIPVYGFLGVLAVISLLILYAFADVYLDDRPLFKSWTSIWIPLAMIVLFAGLTVAVAIVLLIPFGIAWLFPYPLTFAGFLLCLFAFSWSVSLLRKTIEWNKKYTAKS